MLVDAELAAPQIARGLEEGRAVFGSSRERSRGRIACLVSRRRVDRGPAPCCRRRRLAARQSSSVISASLNVMRCAWPATRFKIRVVCRSMA